MNCDVNTPACPSEILVLIVETMNGEPKRTKQPTHRQVFSPAPYSEDMEACTKSKLSSLLTFYVVVVVVFAFYRSFYPTSAVHPVSVLILHPREIQILWSGCDGEKKK